MTEGKEEPIDAEKTEIITDDPNPLAKLISGFCSPTKVNPIPTFEEEDASNKYEPDLAPQTPSKPVAEPEPTEPEPTEPTEETSEAESAPESDVSKKVIANRRKRGVETFVMALVFVLATLLSLQKLGYTLKMVDKSAVEVEIEIEIPPVEEEPIVDVSIDEASPEVEEEL